MAKKRQSHSAITSAVGAWACSGSFRPPNDTYSAGASVSVGHCQSRASGSGAQPSYVERGKDSWRGYFGWMPAGTHAVEYVVRLNGSGKFTLPPTRVEAMYSPAIRGQWPNAPLTVASVGQ